MYKGCAILLSILLIFAKSPQVEAAMGYVSGFNSTIVNVIDLETNTIVEEIPVVGAPYGIALSPDNKTLYVTGSSDSFINIIDTTTNTVTATVFVGGASTAVAVTPDGSKVYFTVYTTSLVVVMDAETQEITGTIPLESGANPFGIAITPDGMKAYVTNLSKDTVNVIDIATDTITRTISIPEPYNLAVFPDGSNVYISSCSSDSIYIVDTVTDSILDTIPVGNCPFGVCFTPDGSLAYISNQHSASVSVIDTQTNIVIATIPIGNSPYYIQMDADGQNVYVANYGSNTVSVIDVQTNTVIENIAMSSPVGLTLPTLQAFPELFLSEVAFPNPVHTNALLTYTLTYGNTGTADASSVIIRDTIPAHTQFVSATDGGVEVDGVVTWNIGTVPVGEGGTVRVVVRVDSIPATDSPIDSDTYTIESAETDPVSGSSVFTDVVVILPPVNIRGQQIQNAFLTSTDLFNVITWSPPEGANPPVEYEIYRNSSLTNIAESVQATEPLLFEDHNRQAGKSYSYFIVSIDEFGDVSTPGSVTVTP